MIICTKKLQTYQNQCIYSKPNRKTYPTINTLTQNYKTLCRATKNNLFIEKTAHLVLSFISNYFSRF